MLSPDLCGSRLNRYRQRSLSTLRQVIQSDKNCLYAAYICVSADSGDLDAFLDRWPQLQQWLDLFVRIKARGIDRSWNIL